MHIHKFCSKFSIKAEVPGNFSRMMHDQNGMNKMMKVCNRTKETEPPPYSAQETKAKFQKGEKLQPKLTKKRKTDYLERKNQRSDFENEKKRGEMGKALDAA